MAKQRVAYIDILKGLLILMVVIGHFENVYRGLGYPDNNAVIGINYIENFWVSFFMPAFFVITGYCSSFNKTKRDIIWGNLKSIMFPAIIFTIITTVSCNLSSWNDIGKSFISSVKSVVKYGGAYWFLSALFLSKQLYFLLTTRIKNEYILSTICLILMYLGLYLYNNSNTINLWYYKHALFMMPYIWLGAWLRKRPIGDSTNMIMGGVYIGAVILLILFGFGVPNISHGLKVSMIQLPLALFLSVSGVFGLLWLAKKINDNIVLEYIGKASIVIYMTHIVIYKAIIPHVAIIFSNNEVLNSCMSELLIIVININICIIVYKLINTKYLKFILGKF